MANSEIKNNELHRVVSTAIIHKPPHKNFGSGGKDGRYLILRRTFEKRAFPGRWTVPGGGLEVSDYINTPKTTPDSWYFAIENSLRREIKEETGLEVGKVKYLLDLIFIRPDKIPVVTLSYYCDWKSGDVKLDEDSIDYAWVTYKEAKNYDLIEGILEEIEIVDRILKGANLDEVEYGKK